MSMTILLIALFWSNVPSAGAHEGKPEAGLSLGDARLIDPQSFGRYADSSRTRAGSVAAPVSGRFGAPVKSIRVIDLGGRNPKPLFPPVPAPHMQTLRLKQSLPKRSAQRTVLGSAALAGLLFLLTLTPRRAPARVPPAGDTLPTEVIVDLLSRRSPPPMEIFTPPPAEMPATFKPFDVTDDPDVLYFSPDMSARDHEPRALPWWAIDDNEQLAINRWDRSIEKEFGMFSLFEFLDAHAKNFPDVDVKVLKVKLRRFV